MTALALPRLIFFLELPSVISCVQKVINGTAAKQADDSVLIYNDLDNLFTNQSLNQAKAANGTHQGSLRTEADERGIYTVGVIVICLAVFIVLYVVYRVLRKVCSRAPPHNARVNGIDNTAAFNNAIFKEISRTLVTIKISPPSSVNSSKFTLPSSFKRSTSVSPESARTSSAKHSDKEPCSDDTLTFLLRSEDELSQTEGKSVTFGLSLSSSVNVSKLSLPQKITVSSSSASNESVKHCDTKACPYETRNISLRSDVELLQQEEKPNTDGRN